MERDDTNPLVFLPIDCTKHSHGVLFGWAIDNVRPPIHCVAGIIPPALYGSKVDDLDLVRAYLHERVQAARGLFDQTYTAPPIVLGRCCADKSRVIPIHYTRPDDKLLQFFNLDPASFDLLSEVDKPSRSGKDKDSQHCSTPLPSPTIETVIGHLNMAHMWNRHVLAAECSPPADPKNTSSRIPRFESLLDPVLRACSALRLSPTNNAPSSTLQQLGARVEQGMYLRQWYPSWHPSSPQPVKEYSLQYSKFYNYVWLILNDSIVGIASGTFLCENAPVLARFLHEYVQIYSVDMIQRALIWLDNWPAGLKLNTQLSQAYCFCFMGLIQMWGDAVNWISPYLPHVIFGIGLSGCLGMTFVLSLLSDVLSVLFLHMYLCYLLATTVFRQQLRLALSLWHLFRGRRYNVLRNRVDSWDYDVDQLLFGTVLFTLVAFLFPTVLVYYTLFVIIRLAIVVMYATLETLLAFMNHFPLFALMVRIKDPLRLPGGIYLIPRDDGSGAIELQSRPVSISGIFSRFFTLCFRLSSHYHPLKLVHYIVTGTYLTSISHHSIQPHAEDTTSD